MAFCKNCGNNLPDGATFCSQCGTAVADTQAQAQTSQTQNATKNGGFFDMPDSTAEFDPADIQENKVMAILSYIWLLVLVPIFGAKNSKYARFHATQGLNVAILSVAIGIVNVIVNIIIGALASSWATVGIALTLSGIFGLVFTLCNLAVLALEIIGIVNACQNKAKKLPVIGKFDILSKFIK